MRTPAHRFPLVDSLRAMAAIAVLGTHAAIFAGADHPGSEVGRYAQRLEAGVAVFFLISGFLLYGPFLRANLRHGPVPGAAAYGWRRVLRIVPAYWVALAVSALVLGLPGVFTTHGVPIYFWYGQIYRQATIGGGLTQAWTLCVEVAFYAFVPLWAAVVRALPGRGVRRELVALAGLAAGSLAWKVVVLWSGPAHQIVVTPWLIALPAYLDQFALGMGLAVLVAWRRERPAAPGLLWLVERAPGLSWAVAAVAFWAVSTRIGLGKALFEPFTRWQYLERHVLYAVVAIGLLAPAVVGDPRRGAIRRILALRPLAWLGTISYGIYLWHLTALTLLERWGYRSVAPVHPYLAWPAAGLALAVVAAAVSWYALERPLLRLKDRHLGDLRLGRLLRRGDEPAGEHEREEGRAGHLPVPVQGGVQGEGG